MRAASPWWTTRPSLVLGQRRTLDRVADVAEDAGNLAAQEDKGDDRDDGDESEDQRILGETLTLLVALEGRDKSVEELHVGFTSFPWTYSPADVPRAAQRYGPTLV